MIRVVKKYRPLGGSDIATEESTVEFPFEINRDVEPDEYRLHLGATFNADDVCADISDALERPEICVKICSPFGLNGKALADPKAVFAHMDNQLQVHGTLGGFHEADRQDYNIWHMIRMANKLHAGESQTEIEAMVPDQSTGKLVAKKLVVANFMGFVNVVSANKLWQKCITWLPFASNQGSPRLLFGSTLMCAMTDPRWFVNPQRNHHLDVNVLRKYFGLYRIPDALKSKTAAHKRSLIAVNTWWWMPQIEDDNVLKEPNAYFHRLFQYYTRQLASRYPVPLASNVAITLTTVKFLSFVWLVWMGILSDEKTYQFDANKFFVGDKAAAASFMEHYNSN